MPSSGLKRLKTYKNVDKIPSTGDIVRVTDESMK